MILKSNSILNYSPALSIVIMRWERKVPVQQTDQDHSQIGITLLHAVQLSLKQKTTFG